MSARNFTVQRGVAFDAQAGACERHSSYAHGSYRSTWFETECSRAECTGSHEQGRAEHGPDQHRQSQSDSHVSPLYTRRGNSGRACGRRLVGSH